MGGAGKDSLIGKGTDIAVYLGNKADYTIALNTSTFSYTITDAVAGRDGVDTLSGIKYLQFADQTYTLPAIAVLPGTQVVSSTGPVSAYSGVVTETLTSNQRFYRPHAQGWLGDQIWVQSLSPTSSYTSTGVNQVVIQLQTQNRLGEVNTNGVIGTNPVPVAVSYNGMNGSAAGSLTFSKTDGVVSGGVFWLDLGSLTGSSYSLHYMPYSFIPFDAAASVGPAGAVSLGNAITPLDLPGLTSTSAWDWNSSASGFVFGWTKPNATTSTNKDLTLDFFGVQGQLLKTQTVANLPAAISAWGLGSDFSDSSSTGNGYYLFTIDTTTSTVSFAQRYDQNGEVVTGFAPLSFRTLFDVKGIQAWNFAYSNYDSSSLSFKAVEFALAGTRTINGVAKTVIDFYKTDTSLTPLVTQEIALTGTLANNRIQFVRLPDGKLVFAYQEVGASSTTGDKLHLTEIGLDGVIIQDLTTTLPVGAVFDRLRSLNNGLVAAELRTFGPNNSSALTMQIFDTRGTILAAAAPTGQYLAGQAGLALTTSANNAVVIGKAGETITDTLGNGTISYEYSALGITVDLNKKTAQISAGDASNEVLSGFTNVLGSQLNDTITGTGSSILMGGAGKDTFVFTDPTKSLAANFQTLADLSSQDVLKIGRTISASSFKNVTLVTNTNGTGNLQEDLTLALAGSALNFVQNSAALVAISYSSTIADAGTYVVVANHSTGQGFQASTDTVIKLQNYQSNSVTASSFFV